MRLARDETGLWVLVAGPPPRLVRYDPRGARRLASIALPHRISAMTTHAGVLWLVDRAGPTLLRLDPDRRTPTEVQRMPDAVPVLSAGGGFLWAVLREQDAIARIEPETGDYTTFAAGHFPTHALVVRRRVFIASRNDNEVIVLDMQSTKPVGEPLAVGLNPYGLATDGRSVWVTGLSENTVTRIARR